MNLLEIRVNVNLVKSEISEAKFEESFSSTNFVRICHPERSKTGTCPACAAHWFREFNPETMQGVDGMGLVPPAGWHEFCQCEDVPKSIATAAGIEPKKAFEMFPEKIDAGEIKLSKSEQALYDTKLARPQDIVKISKKELLPNRQTTEVMIKKLKRLKTIDLIKHGLKVGLTRKQLSTRNKEDIIRAIIKAGANMI